MGLDPPQLIVDARMLYLAGCPAALQALRPADPLDVTSGFYSPAISFCYPGGEGPLGTGHGS